ncbi:uncharacterized protein BP01DRAFT_379428 [Aspergillus saccharolyticus JOP 1030-1]|uniref:RNA recognition motif-containing protein n=1 Tax=Aspergillus saccharolyticus JOP 1030-1 TaxID=1450539 RepID=A0A318ZNC9_9EURO|nr:hypothetical protein BP01DRAFT_379428 [Aspergillus saccharolyticus JOP 1030-1]PYH49036.1 hypothetical protein BP01DRAFT_379428 [Aspergillus saccharolyticus JOP 1030-1]
MPPLPGEERVLTVFADIHYYFTAPSPRPRRHRFDKGSYLYLYQNAGQRKIRIEVANNPGTPEQDAFNGALDKIHVRHSAQFSNLCTITVDGQSQSSAHNVPAFPPPPGAAAEWELAEDESQSMMRLHTLDIYFWTVDDANQFLDILERDLPAAQIESDRHPYLPPPPSTVSSVVQQLETVAITDPAYQNGQTRNSQAEVVANPATNYQAIDPSSALPPPPPLAAAPPHPGLQSVSSEQPPADSVIPQSAPLPYNPAAPAAPEPIKHREKTPPPEDYATGTGLAAAATAPDQEFPFPSSAAPVSPGLSSLISSPASPAPPSMPGTYASPPPSTGLSFSPSVTRSASISSPPGVPSYPPSFLSGETPGYQQHQQQHQPRSSLSSTGSNSLTGPPQATTMTFAPPPTEAPTAAAPAATTTTIMTFAPPPTETVPPTPLQTQPQPPYTHPYGQYQTQPAHTTPPPPIHPAVAIAGYSNYSYEQQPPGSSPNPPAGYDIHRQMYRPTEAEANSRHQKYAKEAMKNPGDRPQTFVKSAYRVENSVNRFLKKLEKRL